MNKKGQTKLLAAVAVFAMVACALAVVMPATDATSGPLNFNGEVDGYKSDVVDGSSFTMSNVALGNVVAVEYDETNKTIKLSGMLNKQSVAYNGKDWTGFSNDAAKAFYSWHWEYKTSDQFYGLVITSDSKFTITNPSDFASDETNGIVLYLTTETVEKVRTIAIGDDEYKLDMTALILSNVEYHTVSNESELRTAIDEGKSIILTSDITGIDECIAISKKVTINGAGHTISASQGEKFTGKYISGASGTIYLFNIKSACTITDLIIDSKDLAFGVNVSSSGSHSFTNVTSNNSAGAGFVIGGGSETTMTDVTVGKNVWGGINVDKASKLTVDAIDEIGSIYSENITGSTITVTGAAPVEMTAKWKADDKATATDFKGYYATVDDLKNNYADKRVQTEVKEGDNVTTAGPAITVKANTSVSTNVDFSKGGSVTISENVTLTVDNGASVNFDKTTVTATGNILASAGTNVSFAEGTTVENIVAAPGASVSVGGETANTSDVLEVTSIADALDLMGYGVPVIIKSDVTLDKAIALIPGADITIGDGFTLTIPGDYSITSTNATFSGKVVGNGTTATVDLFGNYVMKAGSIDVKGSISGSIVGEGTAVVKISGTIDDDLVISGAGSVEFTDVTVNPNVDVTLGKDITYTINGKFYLYGALVVSETGEVTVTVNKDAEFKAFPNSNISPSITISGAGKIDLGESMGVQYIRQDVNSNLVYSQTQTVIIEQSIFINKGATLTVHGQLIVNDGVEVTIMDGGKLVVDNQLAKVIINGDIEVEEGGALDIQEADVVDITGSIESDGTLNISGKVTVKEGGSILVQNGDASVFTIDANGKLTIESGSSVEVRGQADVADIVNKGTVTFNGAVLINDVKISMAASDAVVDLKSFTAKNADADLTITDDGLIFKDNKVPADVISVDGVKYTPNTLEVTGTENVGIKGLTITESVTYKTVKKVTTYYNSFILAGTATIADETAAGHEGKKLINISGPSVDVIDALTVGKNVTLDLKSGNLDVSGTITALADDATVKATAGDINVTGMIETCVKIDANINAFSYEGTVESETVYYYTTLKTAIDNGQTDIQALGTTYVIDTFDIPSGTQVKAGKGHESITIGSSDSRDTVVTVKDGAQFRSCKIEVMGTLTFDNKRDDRNNTITSDVFVEDDVSKTYTNVYTALNNAESGDTVTIYRSQANVILDRDVTVKDGVTLSIPSGKGITVNDDVTVTVDGTVKLSGNMIAETTFDPEIDYNSTIIVNGAFMSVNEIIFNDVNNATVDYFIPGAYYNIVNSAGNWNYVTPVDQAAAVSNDVTDGAIEIWGTNQAGDVSFTGDEDTPVIIDVYGKLTVDNLGLKYASISVSDDANNYQFDGTITSDAGSVKFVNANGFEIDSTINDLEVSVMTISGTPAKADAEGNDIKVTIVSGNVSVMDTVATGNDLDVSEIDFEIAAGATLTVTGTNATMKAKDLAVNGTLVVTDGGKVTADAIYVIGTFTVANADSENSILAGSADVKVIRVGISSDFKVTSEATMNAEKINGWETIYVSAGSTVTEKLLKNTKSTAFYVEDDLWFTVYGNGTSVKAIAPGVIPTENVELEDWSGKAADDTSRSVEKDSQFIIGDAIRFDANIDYDIYCITVVADPGIDAVYIDGKLMTKGYYTVDETNQLVQGYRLYVAAGNHEITYKLGNYFSGEAKMTVNGTSVDGNKFTTSGTDEEDIQVSIYLQGIEASAPETPSTPGSSSDDGMGLTDYLLIVLVVLIVIMAIMVALRMMRS